LSLNHRRRIFRPSLGRGASLSGRLASAGVLVAVAGVVIVTVSLSVRSSVTPSRAPAPGQLSAAVDRVTVLDGDTLRLGGQVVRLEGIVAPARGSVCRGGGDATVDCGSAAANVLASLVRGRPVECGINGHDEQGRPLVDCVAGGTRLNQALVLYGWARAETAELRQPESAARAAGRGIWQSGS
jgi:endonuclease YncB( thermonuclease family)